MPGSLTNTLYPPQVATFMPAFDYQQDAVIYFSLSPYNESTQIKRVHVTVVSQLTNENMLINTTGVFITSMEIPADQDGSGLYTVRIPYTSIKGHSDEEESKTGWQINQFYKVQLRFDAFDGEYDPSWSSANINKYLTDNRQYFSEWSTVCLIRAISTPHLLLRTFDTYDGENPIGFNQGMIPVSGLVYFDSSEETETLQSYVIRVYGKNDLINPVIETPTIYTGDNVDPNDINYNLDFQGVDISENKNFIMRITLTTKNQYTWTPDSYEFQIIDFLEDEYFQPIITAEVDNDDGIVTVHIENHYSMFGTLYVKRASSVDDYVNWEEIYVTDISGEINLDIVDNTVGSLVWYRYSVQMANIKGGLTSAYRSEKVLPDFYDMILSRGDRQLRVQYNYQISNFKPVVNRTKVDTLGGKYPRFAENAQMNYKQFSVTGLISSQMDENKLFMEQRDYFGSEYNNYVTYNDNHRINEYNDWFWEREFREEVVKWLNDGEPKLYRSMMEGVMPVMITDISLTPNKTLGRRLWTFTATIYQIEEGNSLPMLDSLGIYDVHQPEDSYSEGGEVVPEYETIMQVGQLYNYKIENNNDLIANKIFADLKQRYTGVLRERAPEGAYLKNIRIYFHSKPHYFAEVSNGQGGYSFLCLDDMTNPSEAILEKALRGYVIELKTDQDTEGSLYKQIFVNERGYYQVPNNLNVTQIAIQQTDDIVTIDYIVVFKEGLNEGYIISGSSLARTVVGQQCGVFEPNVYLGETIRNKYTFVKTGQFSEKMQNWKGICLDVTPFAVASIRYKEETNYTDYTVGMTGVLHMLKDVAVQDMCFKGVRMVKQELDRQPFLRPWEFVEDPSCSGEISDDQIKHWYSIPEIQKTVFEVFINDEIQDYYIPETALWNGINEEIKKLGYLDTSLIINPQLNTVYMVNGQFKIYYNYGWYDFTRNYEDHDTVGLAIVPVEGMINYYGDVIRSEF